MRSYHIALFIFLLNFSVMAITEVKDTSSQPIFFGESGYAKLNSSNYDREFINESVNDIRAFQDSSSDLFDSMKFLWQAFTKIIDLLFMSTIGFPLVLMQEPFNLSGAICYPLMGSMILVYLVGAYQFLSGRDVET